MTVRQSKTAALILAAGESRRMGFPKALLKYKGTTFLERLIGLLTPRCSPVVVVLGASAERIRAATTGEAAFVLNPDYSLGQTTSMQCGLRALPEDVDGVLFTLVDHPAVAESTLDALLQPPRPLVRVPRFQGERGHPVWLSRDLFPEFLALPVSGAARTIVRSHVSETEFLDVSDSGILSDIDDPAAYRALMEARA